MDAKIVVVLSDLHCGSTVGLCLPAFETDEGSTYVANKIQQELYANWTRATDEWLPGIVGDDPWALVLNGDLIDGNHHGTKQIIHPDNAVHFELARKIIEPLAFRAHRSYVVRGTEAHVGTMQAS